MSSKSESNKNEYDVITREDWDEYRSIQDSGMFNMLDPRAREMTDISKSNWIIIISHYGALKAKFDG
tara:strand:- start:162 stop:362 length:201 start_codon:yes stop_codon:yes gene_type:complete